MHPNRMRRGRRTSRRSHRRHIRTERLADLLRARRRAARKADGYRLGMALYDGYARTARRDTKGRMRVHLKREAPVGLLCELAKDLESLPLYLLLLAGDVRHDVVEDVERGNAGVPRA